MRKSSTFHVFCLTCGMLIKLFLPAAHQRQFIQSLLFLCVQLDPCNVSFCVNNILLIVICFENVSMTKKFKLKLNSLFSVSYFMLTDSNVLVYRYKAVERTGLLPSASWFEYPTSGPRVFASCSLGFLLIIIPRWGRMADRKGNLRSGCQIFSTISGVRCDLTAPGGLTSPDWEMYLCDFT